MIKKFLPLFLILFILGCQDRKSFVPEISPNIIHEQVFSIEDSEKLLKIIPNKEDIILIFQGGKIIRLDSNTFKKNYQYQCISKFELKIDSFENIIVFSSLDDNMFLFDLSKMKVVFRGKKEQFKKIKYVDKNIILYRSLENLIVFDYIKKIKLGKILVKEEGMQDFFIKKNKVFLCTKEKIIEFNLNNREINSFKLKNAASSGFIFDNGIFYYCSNNRYLIKFSLKKNKDLWSIKLPSFSAEKPIRVGNNIAVILKDYNIYFFNKNGSLSWWDKLGATPFLSPIIMSENIAILLRPKKKPSIKFFNLKEKKSVLYKIETPLTGFFFNRKNIYGLSEDTIENKLNIIKIGNIYTVDVKILPKTVLVKDKSIEFKFEPVNLIKPGYSIIILDSEKKKVYSTEIKPEKTPSFIWFTKKEGDFELIIETISENRNKILTKKTFSVIDLKKLQRNFYYRVMSNCTNR